VNLHPKTAAFVIEQATELKIQRDELLAALNGLLGLVQLVDRRDDMPIVLSENHRYKDALALVSRLNENQ
jgi:hypothetical protein